MNQVPGAQAKQRSLLPLWLLVGIFALPSIAAWFFYLNPGWLPEGRSNRGELVHPVRPLPELQLPTVDGGMLSTDDLHSKWTLATIAEASCAEACQNNLARFRQIRLALAENRYRVERLVLLLPEENGDSPRGPALAERFPGTRFVIADASVRERLLPVFRTEQDLDPEDAVFIIDPMGNLMMRYASDAPDKDILHDMEKLFKASKNWIKGAQYGHR